MKNDERLKYISGFTGSAGICLITQDAALLWTDSRYFLQVDNLCQYIYNMYI